MSDMTRAQIRTLVQQLLGDDNATMFPDDFVNTLINRAQQEIARDLEAIVEQTTIGSLGSSGEYVLPSDFIQVKRLLWDGLPLWPQDYSMATRGPIPTGTPFAYYVVGQTLQFFPNPESIGSATVTLEYTASPDDLTNDSDLMTLPDTAVKAVIYWVVRNCKLRDEDLEGAQLAATEYIKSVADGRFDRAMANSDSYTGIRPHETYSHGGDKWLY